MPKYEADIDLANRNTSHTQLVEMVGGNKRVLDVGCASGYLARALVARGCRVWGLDNDAELAEPAREVVEELVIADLEAAPLTDHFEKGAFDVIVFGDVLEHLRDPERTLSEALPLLAEGGRVVVSVPNVTHGSVRLALLEGHWRYTDTGLLDSTHVVFFDRARLGRLFRAVGMTVEDLRGTTVDPLASEVQVDGSELPAAVVEWVRGRPDALVYQFVASARLTEPSDSGELPELVAGAPEEEVRLTDEFTRRHRDEVDAVQHLENLATLRAEQITELEHGMLTLRDHVIGLEATASTATARHNTSSRRLKAAERKLEQRTKRVAAQQERLKSARQSQARLQRRVRELEQELAGVRASSTWRLGRALTAPLRALRRGR